MRDSGCGIVGRLCLVAHLVKEMSCHFDCAFLAALILQLCLCVLHAAQKGANDRLDVAPRLHSTGLPEL